MRGMLPCTPYQVDTKPDDAAREPRSDLSFSSPRICESKIFESMISNPLRRSLLRLVLSMMVSSGLAGAHVQPCPRIKFELLATSF
jgi:hypothetical protein